MFLADCYNTAPADITARRWNPYLGISIQNKVFTAEYVQVFAEWATRCAHERVAIVVVDVLQRINNQIIGRSKPLAALEKAFRRADEVHAICSEALAPLAPEQRAMIDILDWCDIIDGDYFLHNSRVCNAAFAADPEFRAFLGQLTRTNLGPMASRFTPEDVEVLATYMLHELPELATGFLYNGIHFNLNVYPGRIASVYAELLAQPFFAPIRSRLKYIGEYACVEAYVHAPATHG